MDPLTGIPLFLDYVTDIVEAAIDWIGSFIGVITASGHEFLLMFLLIPVVGLGIGLFRRLLNLN